MPTREVLFSRSGIVWNEAAAEWQAFQVKRVETVRQGHLGEERTTDPADGDPSKPSPRIARETTWQWSPSPRRSMRQPGSTGNGRVARHFEPEE